MRVGLCSRWTTAHETAVRSQVALSLSQYPAVAVTVPQVLVQATEMQMGLIRIQMTLPGATDQVAIKSFVLDWHEGYIPWALQQEFDLREVWCYFPDLDSSFQFEYASTSWGACSATCGVGQKRRFPPVCYMPLLNITVAPDNCDMYLPFAPPDLLPGNYSLQADCTVVQCAADALPIWAIAVIAGAAGVLLILVLACCMTKKGSSNDRKSDLRDVSDSRWTESVSRPPNPVNTEMANLLSTKSAGQRYDYAPIDMQAEFAPASPLRSAAAVDTYSPTKAHASELQSPDPFLSPRSAAYIPSDTMRLSASSNRTSPVRSPPSIRSAGFAQHYSNYSPGVDATQLMGEGSPLSSGVRAVNLGALGAPYSNYLGSPSPRGQAEGGWDMHPAMSSASAASEWRQFKASPEMQQFKSRNPEYFAAPATPESRERARRLL